VFSASRQSGRGIRAGLIFCSFCIKTKGKEKDYSQFFSSVLFSDDKYQKSSTNKDIFTTHISQQLT